MDKFDWNSYDTDKEKGHGYGSIYDKYFKDIKYDVKNILEIGTRPGSIRLWLDYFPNANLYGIDINLFHYNDDRFKLYDVDIYDVNSLIGVAKEIGSFDIIIDDGPHTSKSQLIAFSNLLEYINPNGYYVIEDLHTTCPKDLSHNQDEFVGDSDVTMNDYMKNIKNGIYKNYKYINNSEELSKFNLEIFLDRGRRIRWGEQGQSEPSEIYFIKMKKVLEN